MRFQTINLLILFLLMAPTTPAVAPPIAPLVGKQTIPAETKGGSSSPRGASTSEVRGKSVRYGESLTKEELIDRSAQENYKAKLMAELSHIPTSEWTRAENIFTDSIYFRFKLPKDPKFDILFINEMSRLRFKMDKPFATDAIKLILADLSSHKEERLAAEKAASLRIPTESRMLGVGLTGLFDKGGVPTDAVIRAALAPYRNKTLLLVGHSVDGATAFELTRNNRKTRIELSMWSNIAADLGVNLIILGCKSSKFSNAGSPYLLNSGTLIDKIANMFSAHPKTFKEFYNSFTGDGLYIDVNPVKGSHFYDRAFLARKGGAHEALLKFNIDIIKKEPVFSSDSSNENDSNVPLSLVRYFCQKEPAKSKDDRCKQFTK